MAESIRVIEFAEFGDAEVLRVVRRPVPQPGPGEVRIRVQASGLNPIDFKTRQGLGFVSARIRDRLPWRPGYDLAGTVEALGSGVQQWRPGDRVMGLVNFPLPGGAYAEAVVVDANSVVAVPAAVSLNEAAALPIPALTALQALQGPLDGRRITVLGAAGSVGTLAVQWARRAGAHVRAVASQRHHATLHEWGAHEVLDCDPARLPAGTEDRVVDLVGGDVGASAIHTLVPEGCLVTVPTVTAAAVCAAGEALGRVVRGMTVVPDPDGLTAMLAAVAAGEIRVRIGACFRPEDAVAAHRALEQRSPPGKLLIVW